ncbi:NADH:flavin oxidoreductase/NADH oxidase family protein [Aspergillus clavatus NRRL 1]|uniref:FMN binding oxidoreductase, putative n=1 Tax=Aspergillus clavatus (strain ATCC 1007 / CBS 513.65 / DSM 816 / NCTC 3887 / NRRL 1 / QM 1276 / 107) TaxID=344612 RepID=A1CSN9_ASPCL|nr:FMN binding oxidoreductase, putative [Aspergillus clavatus NRRL 1]EAW06326.1 FMN binding oxidoreductase, putative [Aspergillus clavatus NRRL 1]
MPSLADPVTLPCGLVFPNRLVKAALAEAMTGSDHTPTPEMIEVYNQWGQGGWGAVLTGNVQVDVNHLGNPFDPALDGEYTGADTSAALVQTWRRYAAACQQHGVPSIVQVNHPGRQSPRIAGRRGICAATIAPSAVPLQLGGGLVERIASALVFPAPREMTRADIEAVSKQFIDTARLMADAGFSGVELHGAHGYLIDQFLNPKTNLRTDAYGGSPENRAKFVLDILAAIRKVVPPTFCIGIKFNSADHSSSAFEDTMTQIKLLVDAGIDFLEVSGGTYEDPQMVASNPVAAAAAAAAPQKSQRTLAREAFFLEFARETRKRFPTLVLMLTGGFRTRAGAQSALAENACDLVGIGRPAAVKPSFARMLLDESVEDEEARLELKKVKMPFLVRLLPIRNVGAGLESVSVHLFFFLSDFDLVWYLWVRG